MSPDEAQSLQTSRADVWYLKTISFGAGESKRNVKIITQNFNGPCSFIAICNILILRGDIEILPPDRRTVSYEFLSQLVGEYLLTSAPGVDISAALSIMPLTQKGMDLNPLFTGATSFRPAGDGGELKLFEQASIKLVHGWLVDPDSNESAVLVKTSDYDSAVNLIADADHVSKGQLVLSDDDIPVSGQAGPSSAAGSSAGPSSAAGSSAYTNEERQKIEDAIVVRNFLDSTQSQLTYYGLFNLASILSPGSLVALFRSSHLSVLYKPEGEDGPLYTLVTDFVFLNEASVVWERLDDIDGSTWVDSDFVRSSPAGGDFAGHTAESALAAFEAETGQFSDVDPADRALAQQLQDEEDRRAQEIWAERERQRQERQQQQQQQQKIEGRGKGSRYKEERDGKKPKKKPSCIIM